MYFFLSKNVIIIVKWCLIVMQGLFLYCKTSKLFSSQISSTSLIIKESIYLSKNVPKLTKNICFVFLFLLWTNCESAFFLSFFITAGTITLTRIIDFPFKDTDKITFPLCTWNPFKDFYKVKFSKGWFLDCNRQSKINQK